MMHGPINLSLKSVYGEMLRCQLVLVASQNGVFVTTALSHYFETCRSSCRVSVQGVLRPVPTGDRDFTGRRDSSNLLH